MPAIAHCFPTIAGKRILEHVLTNSNNANATTKRIVFDAKYPLHSLYPAAPPIDDRFNIACAFSSVDEVADSNNRLDQQMPVSGTLGAVFLLLERIRYFHFSWHLFVVAGTACHVVAVVAYSGRLEV